MYKVTIGKLTTKGDDDYERYETIYEQIVSQVDVMAVINAANTMNGYDNVKTYRARAELDQKKP